MLVTKGQTTSRLQHLYLAGRPVYSEDDRWRDGFEFPFSWYDFATLVELLTALNVPHFTLLFDSDIDWSPASFAAPSITRLELRYASYLPFRNLLRFLSFFPNLETLILHKADFSPTDDDSATPSATDPSFLIHYPHVVALVRFLAPTQVRHLVWQSTFGSRWTWDRTGLNDEWTTDRTGCSIWDL